MNWSGEVAFLLLEFIQDPEIIRYLLSFAKPIHLKFISEEARLFHESLRMTREKRWALTKELSKQRKFNLMNEQVPITCTLPFDNGEWKKSCELIKSIRYLRTGFLRRKFLVGENHCEDIDLELPLKIKVINQISYNTIKDSEFTFLRWGVDIREAINDFEMYQNIDDSTGETTPYFELPYLLIEIKCNGITQSGYDARRFTFQDQTELYLQEIMN